MLQRQPRLFPLTTGAFLPSEQRYHAALAQLRQGGHRPGFPLVRIPDQSAERVRQAHAGITLLIADPAYFLPCNPACSLVGKGRLLGPCQPIHKDRDAIGVTLRFGDDGPGGTLTVKSK